MNLFKRKQWGVFLLIFLGLLVNCTNGVKNTPLQNYMKKHHISQQVLFVLSDKNCVTCNKAFAMFIEKYIGSEKIFYVLTTRGGLFDTRAFQKAKNIYLDYDGEIYKQNIIQGSGVIFLTDNNAIDTIVTISAFDLNHTLNYLKERVKLK